MVNFNKASFHGHGILPDDRELINLGDIDLDCLSQHDIIEVEFHF